MCCCTMHCWMVCFNAVTVFQDQYVFLYHALLDGLFQCCHCVSGPVCVPVPCTVGWSVSMLSLCFQDQHVFLYHALLGGLFYCCHCVSGPVCVHVHTLLDGVFQCCHFVSGPVCVPVPCTVGWSVSVLSLCLQDQYVFLYHALLDGLFQCCHCVYRTSMCSCNMHCWMVCFSVVIVFAGQVGVHIPCTIGWSVSVLSLCLQ